MLLTCVHSPTSYSSSAEPHHSAEHQRFYTFNPTRSRGWLKENSSPPLSNSLIVLSFIKQGFCSNITCIIFREIQIFQLTQLSRIENVNCELLRGLAKEKLPGILEGGNVQAHGRGNTAQVQGQASRDPDTTQKEQRSAWSLSVVLN